MTANSLLNFPRIPANAKSLAPRKLVFGVGINDATYIVAPMVNGNQLCCPFYRVWTNMLERAYSPKYHASKPTYIGVTVCDEWHSFIAFRGWMETQDWRGKQIDKDLLVHGNKEYHPDACLFVTSVVNTLFNDCRANRGRWQQGVTKVGRRFQARIKDGAGKNISLGYFATSEDASAAYQDALSEKITVIAQKQTEPLRSALLQRI